VLIIQGGPKSKPLPNLVENPSMRLDFFIEIECKRRVKGLSVGIKYWYSVHDPISGNLTPIIIYSV